MIVICPTCHSKYSVQSEAIGAGKLVRCAICSTMWQQDAIDEAALRKHHVMHIIKWTFFWFVLFVSLFSLFFAKNALIKIWQPVTVFYDFMGINPVNQTKAFSIQNVSNFFVKKNGKLYMGLRGELANISNVVQIPPCLTISLKDDDLVRKSSIYKKSWTHDIVNNKLLPNQKVIFETEIQSVPCNDLICEIKLNVL